jgi:hypothetical protein
MGEKGNLLPGNEMGREIDCQAMKWREIDCQAMKWGVV